VPFVLLALSGCSAPTINGSGIIAVPYERYGTLLAAGLPATGDLHDLRKGDPCVVEDGYGDVSSGAQIIVSSSSGKVLASGTLGKGGVSENVKYWAKCLFPFTLSSIPRATTSIK
jgi:hypothetical protein